MMRRWPWVAHLCVGLLGCSWGCSSPASNVGATMPSGVRPAAGMAPTVRGAGVEALVMRVEASPGEIHEALVAAGGQRDTTAMESKAGLEVITMDASALEPTLRALHPIDAPSLTWLGMPVRWSKLLLWPDGHIAVRAWPLSLEDGEAAALDLHVAIESPLRRERLLLPGQVLLLVPGGDRFPLELEQAVTPGPLARGMAGEAPVVMVFRPRFADARAR